MNKINSKIIRTGPYKSALIPVKKIIFDAWFGERKTGREIQRILSEQHGIKVAVSTITRFIKVRRKKEDPHDMPESMRENTIASVGKSRKIMSSGKAKALSNESKTILDKMQSMTKEEAFAESVRLRDLRKQKVHKQKTDDSSDSAK